MANELARRLGVESTKLEDVEELASSP